MLEELNSLKVLVAAVDICSPFALLPVIVKVEHGRHSVYSETVHMELVEPVISAGNKERAYLSLTVIENSGAPCLMLLFAVICVFVAAGAVELIETCLVLGKVCRYPVKDNADACGVEHIYHLSHVVGSSVARGRCKIARYLIAPRSVVGVLRQGHELNMSIGHLLEIRYDLLSKRDIIKENFPAVVLPRAEVYLIHVHRAFVYALVFLFIEPLAVAPLEIALENFRSGPGSCLIVRRIGVSLHQYPSVLRFDTELISVELFKL